MDRLSGGKLDRGNSGEPAVSQSTHEPVTEEVVMKKVDANMRYPCDGRAWGLHSLGGQQLAVLQDQVLQLLAHACRH